MVVTAVVAKAIKIIWVNNNRTTTDEVAAEEEPAAATTKACEVVEATGVEVA